MVCQASTLPRSFHTHLWFVDQLGRTLVRRTLQQTDSARRVSQRQGTGNCDSRFYRGPQRRPHALRLVQNRRPDPSQHRPLRSAHSHLITTYRANHWDRRLASQRLCTITDPCEPACKTGSLTTKTTIGSPMFQDGPTFG